MRQSSRRSSSEYLGLILFLGLAVVATIFGYLKFAPKLSFKNPIAFTISQDHLIVMEHDGRVLNLTIDAVGSTLRLNRSHVIESDDDQYYYMVRDLVSAENGIIVGSHIFDKKTRTLLGRRYREYYEEKPFKEIFTLFLKNPEEFPELFCTSAADGDYLFANGIQGQRTIWRIPRAGGVVMKDGQPPKELIQQGNTNLEMNVWQGICQGADRSIYLSLNSGGGVVKCSPQGVFENNIGRMGFTEGDLLAPQDLMFLSYGLDTNRYLTVASRGNRTWVQFNAAGEVVRPVSPLSLHYPYPDMLLGEAVQGAGGAWFTFDLVNKCFVKIQNDRITTINHYATHLHSVALVLFFFAVLSVVFGIVGFRRHWFRMCFRCPFFIKLLLFFVPLIILNSLLIAWSVEDAMRDDNLREYLDRSANLSEAVIGNLAIDALESIEQPEDRGSPQYEKIYQTVQSILNREKVNTTPKWILHKIKYGRYYFGINIWRGALYEPYIIPQERKIFFDVLKEKKANHGRFTDEQGEWFSYLTPILNDQNEVIYVLELYRATEEMGRAAKEARRRAAGLVGTSLIITLLLGFAFSRYLVRPLQKLTHAVRAVSQGDFDHKINVRTRDEIGDLSHDFNQMMIELKQYMVDLQKTTVEKERIESDIRLARDVQAGILPTDFPPFPKTPSIEICARIEPAKLVGGDFYDFFDVDDDHYGAVVADVSGKGMAAGLFMMLARAVLRGNVRGRLDPAETLLWVNRLLSVDNPSVMFVTLFYLICEKKTGRVRYCNAGHNSPFLIRKNAGKPTVEQLPDAQNMVLGVEESMVFKSEEITLSPGDTIVLYTDGVTEPVDREDTMFGEKRLGQTALRFSTLSNAESCDKIYAMVSDHQQGLEPFDDFTLLYFKYLG